MVQRLMLVGSLVGLFTEEQSDAVYKAACLLIAELFDNPGSAAFEFAIEYRRATGKFALIPETDISALVNKILKGE